MPFGILLARSSCTTEKLGLRLHRRGRFLLRIYLSLALCTYFVRIVRLVMGLASSINKSQGLWRSRDLLCESAQVEPNYKIPKGHQMSYQYSALLLSRFWCLYGDRYYACITAHRCRGEFPEVSLCVHNTGVGENESDRSCGLRKIVYCRELLLRVWLTWPPGLFYPKTDMRHVICFANVKVDTITLYGPFH